MTISRATLTLALLATTGSAAYGAPPAISADTLKSVTQTLSSDAYEGRKPTTPAEEKTTAYIVDRFKQAGLRPGNKGSWFQEVPMVEITASPKTRLDVSGGKTPLSFAYKTDIVAATYRVRPQVSVANSDIVFVGYGINAPEKGWNDYAGIDVKGKTVIVLINDPDWKTQSLDGPFGGRAMTYYGRWTYKYEEAARQGAAAVFIVHDTKPAAYPFDVVVSSWTGPQLEMDATNDHMDQSAVIGWLSNDAARRLLASTGQNLDTLAAAAAKQGFKAVPLQLKASITLDNTIRRQKSKNVIGILPGKTRPQDVVLYSAHWDHLGHCEPIKGDDICNGAVDNASGVAGLVALAEAQAKAGPAARSQVFLAVTGEESGLLGSQYYAENPIYPLSHTVGGVNMDGLNVKGRTHDIVVVGPGKSELEESLKRWAVTQNRVIVPEPTPEKGFYYRSDHFSFAKKGVPMLDADSGQDLLVGGVAAGKQADDDYTEHRYHKPQDEYDPKWDWSGAVEDLTLYYDIGRELADGTAWPNWYPGTEFRAIRDKSREGM